MPLRFWKKEKHEKGKEHEEAAEEAKEAARERPAPPEPSAKAEPELKQPEAKPPAPAAPPKPGAVEGVVNDVHASLVDLGLTVPPTKAVFAKRVAAYPGGEAAFLTAYD